MYELKNSERSVDFLFLAFFGVFLPYFTTNKIDGNWYEFEIFYLWGLCFIYCCFLTWKKEGIGFSSGVYFSMIYVFFMLIPLLQISYYTFPLPKIYPLDADSIWMTITVITVFVLGSMMSFLFLESNEKKKINFVYRINHISSVIFAGVISILLTIVGIIKTGGISSLFSSRFARGELVDSQFHNAVAGSSQMFESLARVPMLAYAIIFCLFARSKFSHGNIIAFILCVIVVLINNPLATSRFFFASSFIAIILCWFPFLTKTSVKTMFFLLSIGLVFVLPIFSTFRGEHADIYSQINNFDIVTDVIGSMDFDAFQQASNAINYVHQASFMYGLQLLSAIFFWVPRFLWQDKGLPSGTLVSGNFNIGTDNLSMPMFSEFYLDFGFVGVFLLSFVFYKIVKLCDLCLKNYSLGYESTPITAFFLLFAPYQVILLRGSLLGVLDLLVVFGVFVYLLSKIMLIKEDKKNEG